MTAARQAFCSDNNDRSIANRGILSHHHPERVAAIIEWGLTCHTIVPCAVATIVSKDSRVCISLSPDGSGGERQLWRNPLLRSQRTTSGGGHLSYSSNPGSISRAFSSQAFIDGCFVAALIGSVRLTQSTGPSMR